MDSEGVRISPQVLGILFSPLWVYHIVVIPSYGVVEEGKSYESIAGNTTKID